MNDFHTRWQRLTHAARDGVSEPVDSAPFGFATRVLSLRRTAGAGPAASLVSTWQRLTVRALGIAILVVLLCATLNFVAEDDDSLSPPIADSMADAFWLQ
jgi:hypothetical protein